MSKNVMLIDALVRALDACEEAMLLALAIESDDRGDGDEGKSDTIPAPPSDDDVTDETKPTGKRLPFKSASPPMGSEPPAKHRSGGYAFQSFSGERVVKHVRAAWERENSVEGRRMVSRTMKKLVAIGMATEKDFEGYIQDETAAK